MATVYYCIPGETPDANVTPAITVRAGAFNATLVKGDPSGVVTVWPSIVVFGEKSSPVAFPDDTEQATTAEVLAALAAATTAETDYEAAIGTANASISTSVAGLAAQITQAQIDIATLSSSTDPLAPVIARAVEGLLALTQAVATLGMLGGHVDPAKVPKI